MDEDTFGGAVLFIILILLAVGIGAAVGDGLGKHNANQLITECENTLPRDQHCELIAIPKEVER